MSLHHFLFYCPSLVAGDGEVSIEGDEHRHLSRVLRMREGETMFATNGTGLLVSGTVSSIGRDRTVCDVEETISREDPARRVVLALALIAKPKFEQALEQCVELGIAECIPFVSENSQVKAYGDGFLGRLDRIALAAMKQSFRATLPHVSPIVSFDHLTARAQNAARVFVGDPDAEPVSGDAVRGSDVLVVVGPEAGLSPSEQAAFRAMGANFVSTSAYRLRSETAAVTLVAAVAAAD